MDMLNAFGALLLFVFILIASAFILSRFLWLCLAIYYWIKDKHDKKHKIRGQE